VRCGNRSQACDQGEQPFGPNLPNKLRWADRGPPPPSIAGNKTWNPCAQGWLAPAEPQAAAYDSAETLATECSDVVRQRIELPCAPGCEDHGNCNFEDGRCECAQLLSIPVGAQLH